MLTLTDYQNQAVKFADMYWRKNIVDGTPAGNRTIGTEIIPAVRAPMPDYTNGSFAWCGAFVASCCLHAGMHHQLVRMMASWYRAETLYGRYGDDPGVWDAGYVVLPSRIFRTRTWHEETGDVRRCFRPGEQPIRPGDILIHRPKPKEQHGHVFLCAGGISGTSILCLEGNAKGTLPGGKRGEGVVRNFRPLSYIDRVVRPSLCDFDRSVRYEDRP